MLYCEFLEGTNAPDNMHTYAEYKRIEEIYNNDNSMEKHDAYALYQKPDALTAELLTEISRLKAENYQLRAKNHKLEKSCDELKENQQKYNSLMEEAQKLKNMFTCFKDNFYYHLEDKMGIF